MRKPDFKAFQASFQPFLLSALLFALSYPSYPAVRLEVLAWFWAVPMFLALKDITSFGKFLAHVFPAMLIGCSLVMTYLLFKNTAVLLPVFVGVGVVQSVPFVLFFAVRRGLGWRPALWSFPLVWTACDWLHHGIDGTIGWLGFAVTQARLYPLIQYMDVTGMWGVTFWLMLFNVLLVMAVDDWRAEREKNPATARTFLVRRLAVVLAGMVAPPLLHAAYVFADSPFATSDGRETISVLMVQPNAAPGGKEDPESSNRLVGRMLDLTEAALNRHQTDVAVWPETAVALPLRQDQSARDFLSRNVRRLRTPLITGTFDRRTYDKDQKRPFLLERSGKYSETFNSAVLVSPDSARSQAELPVYHKRKLMPFVERVPWSETFPTLLDFGPEENLAVGDRVRTFSFTSRAGRTVKVGTPICYEHFYPATMADFVADGAEMIALLSNDGWFSRTHGEYQIAAFTILRAVETRRGIARCANTGVTCFIDEFGRVYGDVPWWSEQTAMGDVRLSRELSFYVRHPDLFPKLCFWVSMSLVALAVGNRRRSAVGSEKVGEGVRV